MGSSGVQIVCVSLGILGLIGTIVCCAIPRWKVRPFYQSILPVPIVEEGLWMNCVVQSTDQRQCKKYDSLLMLSADLQAARGMVIISCMLCSLCLLTLFAGADFTTCVESESAKAKISLVAGIGLILGGLLVIVPVSWSAHNTVRDFNNPLRSAFQRWELGACIFVGWAAGGLLVLAGGLLCCFSKVKSGGGSPGAAKYYSNGAGAPSAPNKNYV